MDTRTPTQRSRSMAAVQTRNTGPEWAVRRLLHANGYRYRLHAKALPGKPDIVFPGRKKAIFVHGCFWHGHGCPKGRAPKSKLGYWGPKLEANRLRDARDLDRLRALGWQAETVWQCEIREPEKLLQRLRDFLTDGQNPIDRSGLAC
jgi:DNA mismatch endonuclease (patch repair protein)